ncbi:hypothetical protein BDZ91DRAFT_641681, partial [Kalaharituber pfeilii]
EELLKILSPLEPHKRHRDIKCKRVSNTGDWILDTEQFKTWKQGINVESQVLSFLGMPGAGKTVLTSLVIDHLLGHTAKQPAAGVAYLYCDYRDQHVMDTVNVIGSLIKQLV